jgi:hypothetical protein
MDKPFIRAIGKVYSQNQLFARLYLPNAEMNGLTSALSQLIKDGLVKTYERFVEDAATIQRQTISYEYFSGNAWNYDPEKYAQQIVETAEKFR